MGCGKSKHANVASGNTVLKRKTSTTQSKKRKEIKTEVTKSNMNDDMIISKVEDKESEIVKEVGSSNGDKDKVENEHAQEEKMFEKSKENVNVKEKKEEIVSKGKYEISEDAKTDPLIKENEQFLNNIVAEMKEQVVEENKTLPKNSGKQEDSLKKSELKMDIAIVEEKDIPNNDIDIATANKFEGEKGESLEENNEELNAALQEKELVEEKNTNSKDSECGKGDSLEADYQKVDDYVAQVKEPGEEKREENVAVDVSTEEETLVKEEDNNNDREALTLQIEETLVKEEENNKAVEALALQIEENVVKAKDTT